jgi:hypothetical protein
MKCLLLFASILAPAAALNLRVNKVVESHIADMGNSEIEVETASTDKNELSVIQDSSSEARIRLTKSIAAFKNFWDDLYRFFFDYSDINGGLYSPRPGEVNPFCVPDTNGPSSSNNPCDIWAIQHILHGMISAYVARPFLVEQNSKLDENGKRVANVRTWPGIAGGTMENSLMGNAFWISFSTAVVWELVESFPGIIRWYRDSEPGYRGDSVVNIISDLTVEEKFFEIRQVTCMKLKIY